MICPFKTCFFVVVLGHFKYLIQIKKVIEVPEVKMPPLDHSRVEVPKVIENYIQKRKIQDVNKNENVSKKSHKKKKQ